MAFVYWYIRDFFLFVGSIIGFVFDLLWSLIQILINALQFISSVVASLPIVLTGSFIVIAIICVLYKVLGRESSG